MADYDVQEKQLVIKLNKRIIPLLVLVYVCLALDKHVQFETRVMNHYTGAGLETDSQTYGTSFVLSYVAYGIVCAAAIFPSTFLGRRVGPNWWFAGMMCGWGLVVCCGAAIHNTAGLMVIRCLLGIFQAGTLTGILLHVVSFYTREEWTSRLSWVLSSTMMGMSFIGIFIDWSHANTDGVKSLGSWRWLFVMEGVLTIVAGALVGYLLPGYPETCAFLTPADRHLATQRSRDGAEHADTSIPDDNAFHRRSQANQPLKAPALRFDSGQLILAFTDARNWLFTLTYFVVAVAMDMLITIGPDVTAASFSLNTTSLVNVTQTVSNVTQSLNSTLSTTDTTIDTVIAIIEAAEVATRRVRILSAGPYVFGGILAIVCGHQADRSTYRSWFVSIPLAVSSLGFILTAVLPVTLDQHGWVRYIFGLWPACLGLVCAFPSLLSYSLDKAQGDTNRITVVAMTIVLGQSFSQAMAAPNSFILPNSASATWYATSTGLMGGAIALASGCILLIQYLYQREEQELWGKGPGLRRLLNDADEGKAWDFEMSSPNVFDGEIERSARIAKQKATIQSKAQSSTQRSTHEPDLVAGFKKILGRTTKGSTKDEPGS